MPVSQQFRATYPRMQHMDNYNEISIRPPSTRIWFLNGSLVRVYHADAAGGMTTLFNVNEEKLVTVRTEEWVRKRKKAWRKADAAKLLNRHPKWFATLATRGVLPLPIYSNKGSVRGLSKRGYYEEETIYEMRQILVERPKGPIRRDGLITNNTVPSLQELKRAMGQEMLQYTKTQDGRMIPIWRESV